jgi:hypothetical protein
MNQYRVLVGKPKVKRPLQRPKREDNIKRVLRGIEWEDEDWVHLAQDRDQWLAVLNTVMNLQIP